MKNSLKLTGLGIAVLLLISMMPVAAIAQLANPGFENGYADWDMTGASDYSLLTDEGEAISGVEFTPFFGTQALRLSNPGGNSAYVWANTISQTITLDPNENFLNFYYNFWTFDEAPFDNAGFMVEINGKTVFSVSAGDVGDGKVGTLDYTGWQLCSLDISEYYSDDPDREASILISFSAGNTSDQTYASGVYLDAITITPNAMPVPASMLLLLSGLIGFVGVRRVKG